MIVRLVFQATGKAKIYSIILSRLDRHQPIALLEDNNPNF